MPYTANIGRTNPTCILLIVDETASMARPVGGDSKLRRCDVAAEAANRLLQMIVFLNSRGSAVVDRMHFGLIGYGLTVGPAWQGSLAGRATVTLSEVAEKLLRVERRTKRVDDGEGGQRDVKLQFPVWYDARAEGESTAAEALSFAGGLLREFVSARPTCFPPLVFHLAGGESLERSAGEFAVAAAVLQAVCSDDGAVLLLNQYIGDAGCSPIAYPSSSAGLPNAQAELLFQTACELQDRWRDVLAYDFPGIQPAARGYMQNEESSRFLHIFAAGHPPYRPER